MIEDVIPIVAIVLIFGGGTLFLLAISPIGKAIAERIRQRSGPAPGGAPSEAILEELQQLRREVGELAERVDFMERLQAKSRAAERLAPPG